MNPPPEERSSVQGGAQRRELEPSRKEDPPGIWKAFQSIVIGIGQRALDLAERWGEASVRGKELDDDITNETASASIGKSDSRADSLYWGTEAEDLRSLVKAETRRLNAIASREEAAAEMLKTANQLMNQLLPGEAAAIVLEKQKMIQSGGGTVEYRVGEVSPVDASPGAGLGKPAAHSEMADHLSIVKYCPTIGIITALARESAAVRAILAPTSHYVVGGKGAGRRYWRAEVRSVHGGIHRVIIAQAGMGTNIAGVRAAQLLNHFDNVANVIMCGISGGVPNVSKPEEHVRLGDIVISNIKGIVQYDFVKRSLDESTVTVNEIWASPHRPSASLMEAVGILESDRMLGQYPWDDFLQEGLVYLSWARPDQSTDKLADSSNPTSFLKHPSDPERRVGHPRVFLGPIASSNTLLKDPLYRDVLRDDFGVRAVEMEASGIVDATWQQEVGYLVVRGVCDYCDSHKGDEWQKYAAVAAAAYVRAVLESMPAES